MAPVQTGCLKNYIIVCFVLYNSRQMLWHDSSYYLHDQQKTKKCFTQLQISFCNILVFKSFLPKNPTIIANQNLHFWKFTFKSNEQQCGSVIINFEFIHSFCNLNFLTINRIWKNNQKIEFEFYWISISLIWEIV